MLRMSRMRRIVPHRREVPCAAWSDPHDPSHPNDP